MAFNERAFFGTDGDLSISDPKDAPEGVYDSYFGANSRIGKVTDVSLYVRTEIKSFHELGARTPSELRAGNVTYTGSVGRAYINGALLRLMLGSYATDQEKSGEAFPIPSFTLTLALDNGMPAGDEGNSTLTVRGVMFDSWKINLPEDDFMLERLTFKASRIEVTDTEAPAAGG